MIAIIGTSDRPCWLAEACKNLLLLTLLLVDVSLLLSAYSSCLLTRHL